MEELLHQRQVVGDAHRDAPLIDAEGYLVVDETMSTPVAGAFADGDVRKTVVKQAVISAADGALAAISADRYLRSRKRLVSQY